LAAFGACFPPVCFLQLLLQLKDPATQVPGALQQSQRLVCPPFVEEIDAVVLLGRLQQPVDGSLAVAFSVTLEERCQQVAGECVSQVAIASTYRANDAA